jgi:hypothetical protein
MMPHKFNASRRHKFEKKRQKVTNWRVYNEGLRQRGDVNQTGFTGEHKAWKVSHDKRKFREPFFDRSACARSAFGA